MTLFGFWFMNVTNPDKKIDFDKRVKALYWDIERAGLSVSYMPVVLAGSIPDLQEINGNVGVDILQREHPYQAIFSPTLYRRELHPALSEKLSSNGGPTQLELWALMVGPKSFSGGELEMICGLTTEMYGKIIRAKYSLLEKGPGSEIFGDNPKGMRPINVCYGSTSFGSFR